MHCYETIYILHPDLGEEAVTAARGKVADLITARNGRLYRRENWGKKRLAYDIAKQNKGNYQLIRYVGDAALVTDMERVFRLDEAFLKFLTIKLDIDPESVKDEEPVDEPVAAESESGAQAEARGTDAEDAAKEPAGEPEAEEAEVEPAATGE